MARQRRYAVRAYWFVLEYVLLLRWRQKPHLSQNPVKKCEDDRVDVQHHRRLDVPVAHPPLQAAVRNRLAAVDAEPLVMPRLIETVQHYGAIWKLAEVPAGLPLVA